VQESLRYPVQGGLPAQIGAGGGDFGDHPRHLGGALPIFRNDDARHSRVEGAGQTCT
jgi:hypothetical protein